MNNNRDDKNFAGWIKYSTTFRIAIIGVLVLLLLIPVSMVGELIYEREHTKRLAVAEISQKWGEQQTIAGPIISIPYKEYSKNENGEQVSIIRYAHFLPELLTVNGIIEPQIRSRGIFDAVVYSSELDFSGKFTWTDIYDLGVDAKNVDWGGAFMSVGISDIRGIGNNMELVWNNDIIPFNPGVQSSDAIFNPIRNHNMTPFRGISTKQMSVIHSDASRIDMQQAPNPGISARLPIQLEHGKGLINEFSFKLSINGSRDLQIVPVGKTSKISLQSDWDAPSFSGAFLPDSRTVSSSGFEASWKIIDLNRGFPQSWLGSSHNIYTTASGVSLLSGVDDYAKTQRSVKYAVLMITLTFLIFFFAEIFNRKKIHPVQYILVGLAIVLFYSLLISISEIIGFGVAYLISSLATIGLITLYSKSVLASNRLAIIQGLILSFLYLFIYIILQIEDYALVMGSILLFVILAIIMHLSRKIDWYSVGSDTQNK